VVQPEALFESFLTGFTAEEMGLVKWRAEVYVKDDDLSLMNICFHFYCYLLKGYCRTCG